MDTQSPFTHILVPTDGSETSINAGRLAIQIAVTHKIPLTFVYVVNRSTAEEIAHATSKTTDMVCKELSDKAQRYLDYLSRLALNRGLYAEQITRNGIPYLEITELAREKDIDLIVIGRARGQGTQRLARIGSVAERVIEYAPCPVLTVRYSPKQLETY